MSKKKVIKQATEQLVYHKLVGALAELRVGTNDKKFTKKLKDASKMLAVDISEVLIKTIPPKIKESKKRSKKTKHKKSDALKEVKIKKIKQSAADNPPKETVPAAGDHE